MKKETLIQNQIRIALSEFGICIRLNTGCFKAADGMTVKCGIAGMPDLLFLGPNGQTVWIEVKTLTGKVSPAQTKFIARLLEMGHSAGIAHNEKEAIQLTGRIYEKNQ